MPIISHKGINYITTNFDLSNIYWKEFSDLYYIEYGDFEYTDTQKVTEICKFGLKYFISKFEQILSKENELAFFIFVYGFHTNTIDFYLEQLKGNSIGAIDEIDLATERRIYKLILEQACISDLIGTETFVSEINAKKEIYTQKLEHLLYIGYWIYGFSDFTSKNTLIPNSVGVKYENGLCSLLTYQPYPVLFEHIMQDIPKHDKNCIVDVLGVNDFIAILNSTFNISYSNIISFLVYKNNHKHLKHAIIYKDILINEISKELKYDKSAVETFFAGFTLSRKNKLPIDQSIYKSQNLNRFLYRPILELVADNKTIWLICLNKWLESFSQIVTNAILWQECPNEWKQFKSITQYIQSKSLTHEKLLINELVKILKEKDFIFDFNINSLKQNNNSNNIPINKQTVGEIDLIFIHNLHKTLYVCECKYNRSKYDLTNWRNDNSNFLNYENQLSKKVNWVTQNIEKVSVHLKQISNNYGIDIDNYIVKGIFLINAPTFYMYDGSYRTFTIYEFDKLLTDEFRNIIYDIKSEPSNKHYFVEHPYFKNLAKQINDYKIE